MVWGRVEIDRGIILGVMWEWLITKKSITCYLLIPWILVRMYVSSYVLGCDSLVLNYNNKVVRVLLQAPVSEE